MNDDELQRELEGILGAIGTTIPPDRLPGVLNCVRDMRNARSLLRPPRSAESEPATTFSLSAVLQSV
jgi:hypothetical protein